MERVEDNLIVVGVDIFLVNQNRRCAAFKDFLGYVFIDNGVTLYRQLVTFDTYHFAGILVDVVLSPRFYHTCSKFAAGYFLEIGFIHLKLFSKVENLDNVLIGFKTNSAKQCGNGQLLLTVDVSPHHIVNISGKFNPRATERNNTRRVKLRAIGVLTLTEENARRTVQLRHHHALGTIYHKGTLVGHIWYVTQIHVLDCCVKIFVIRVSTE